MYNCITCGAELRPERAAKYDYCMSPECQAQNAKGLTMVAVGVNKAAEQYMILDEQTSEDLADGKYHDQRRGYFGRPVASPAPAKRPVGTARPPARAAKPQRQPWTKSQERLALLYNEQGLRPDEIARKLGLSPYLVTQIILNTRTRGKL
jgi:DNA-binding CsgD family transcriptional regulator